MVPKLYMRIRSPQCRSVLMTAKALCVNLEHVQIALEDTSNPTLLKLNPQYTIPTLEDGEKVIWDCHAIMIYLISTYGKDDDSLYPNDSYKQAIVNQRMHFNSGVAFPIAKQIRDLILFGRIKFVPMECIETTEQCYSYLENFLGGNLWIAGDSVTLADLSLIPTVTFLDFVVPIDAKRFPNICRWLKIAETLPYYDMNQEGDDALRTFFKSLMDNA